MSYHQDLLNFEEAIRWVYNLMHNLGTQLYCCFINMKSNAKLFLFLLFATFANCSIIQGYKNLLDFEAQYDYHALISSKVEDVTNDSSGFSIDAKFILMTVKTLNNHFVAVFQNVQFSTLYMNETIADSKNERLLESIEKPFIIRMSKDGIVREIYTDNDDEEWSVNLKKGVSTLFQLEQNKIDTDMTRAYGFSSTESCLFGTCHTFNTVAPKNNSHFILSKSIFQPYPYNNIHQGRHTNPLTASSERYYTFEARHNVFSILSIEAWNLIMLTPLNGFTDTQTITVKQLLNKDNQNKISDLSIFDQLLSEFKQNKMTNYKMKVEYPNEFIVADRPNKEEMKSIIANTKLAIENIARYLKEDNIDFKPMFINSNESISYVIEMMRNFDESDLQYCFDSIGKGSEEISRLFFNLLPHIGTDESVGFIRNLIVSKTCPDELSVNILQQMHFYSDQLSTKAILDFSTISEIPGLSEKIKNAAILTTASLISKFSDDESDVSQIINQYIEGIKSSNETSTSYLIYMGALKNTKSLKALVFLEEIIRDQSLSAHTRSLAMWSAKDAHMKDLELLNSIYWPIIENPEESLEVKLTALNILMTDSNNFMKLFWLVKEDPKVYGSYYGQLKVLARCNLPDLQLQSFRARSVLQIAPTVENDDFNLKTYLKNNFNYVFDYFDDKYDFGAILVASKHGDFEEDGFVSLYVQFSRTFPYTYPNSEALYIYVRSNQRDTTMTLPHSYTDLLLMDVPFDRVSVDIVYLKNRVVVQSHRLKSHSDFETQILDEANRQFDHYDFLTINQQGNGQITLPTDIGIPIVYYVNTPEYQNVHFERTEMKDGLIDYNFRFKQFSHHVYGLKVYDPLTKIWHGTRRNHILDVQLPINVTINESKLTIHNENNRGFGIRSFVYGESFMINMNNNLIKTDVNLGDLKEPNRENIWKSENNFTGLSFGAGFFDCEAKTQSKLIVDMKSSISSVYDSKYDDYSLAKIPMRIERLQSLISLLPTRGVCGFGAIGKFDFDKAELDIDVRNFALTYEISRADETKGWHLTYDTSEHAIVIVDDVPKNFNITKCRQSNGNSNRDSHSNNDGVGILYGKSVLGACPAAMSSIKVHSNAKNSTLTFKYKNLPQSWLNFFTFVKDSAKSLFSDYFERIYNKKSVKENSVVLAFDLDSDLDVYIATPSEEYAYRGIPFNIGNRDFPNIDLEPSYLPPSHEHTTINSNVPSVESHEETTVNSNVCTMEEDSMMGFNGKTTRHRLSSEIWEKMMEVSKDDGNSYKIFVKKNDSHSIGLRVIGFGDQLDIFWKEGFNMYLNGKLIKNIGFGYYSGSWYDIKILKVEHSLSLKTKGEEIYLSYDGHKATISLNMTAKYSDGLCFNS